MAAEKRWFFTKEQLESTPSRRHGYDAAKELSCRQQAANLIQDMGQRLHVNQLCINTAMVYMHRFFVFHSFTHFHRNAMATAALFLAAKVEEQPRKLEHVIKVSQLCLMKNHHQPIDTRSEEYLQQAADLVMNENVLLQTLGFDVGIDHPHTHIVRCCHLVRASKDLAQTSYFMATNSLHLTTMCLQYKPTVVACFCIHLACKWSNWEIPQSNEGKPWFWYVDKTVTLQLLEQLTSEFLSIFDKCPSRLKKRIYQQNSQNSLSSQNFSLDMDASRKSLSTQNSGVSFQQPISTMDNQLQSGTSTSDKEKRREHNNIQNLRQSYGQPALHKKATQSAPKELIPSHSNTLKMLSDPPSQQQHPTSQQHPLQQHQQAQQLQSVASQQLAAHQQQSFHQLQQQHQQQQQQQQQQHQQQHQQHPSHHSSSRGNSIQPVKIKQEAGLTRVNSVPLQDVDQFGAPKQMKSSSYGPSTAGGYPRNGTTLPHPHPADHDLMKPDMIKKEPVNDSHLNVNMNINIKRESNSNSHYQKHSSNLPSSQSTDVISSVLKEVTSSSAGEPSLSQNSVQVPQETAKVKQERLSPVQTSTHKTHSIFSPELRSPPPKYEQHLSHPIKTEPSNEGTPKKSSAPPNPVCPTTPSTPTNPHKKTPVANTPELVPVVPRLENMTAYKNIIDKSKSVSVTISNSNDIVNSSTYVPTNNSASINSSAQVESRLEDDSVEEKSSSVNAQNQHLTKAESSSNNSIPILSISSSSHHKKKKKNKDKDRDKSKHREHKSEHKKHHKKHKEKDKRRDKEKDEPQLSVPKLRIISDPAPIKITIPKDKLKDIPSTSSLKFKLSTVMDDRPKERHKDRDRDREKDGERENYDQNPSSLKIKISRDVLHNSSSKHSSSRKRDRSHDTYTSSSSSAPPSKKEKYYQE